MGALQVELIEVEVEVESPFPHLPALKCVRRCEAIACGNTLEFCAREGERFRAR